MENIILGVLMFTGIVTALVALILIAKSRLVASGLVKVLINDQKMIEVPAGGKLLGALADNNVFVSSACGGGGTCAQCRVVVNEGGGEILPTERSHISKREACDGHRLSCQVAIKQDMKIEVEPDVTDKAAQHAEEDADEIGAHGVGRTTSRERTSKERKASSKSAAWRTNRRQHEIPAH